MQSSPIEFLLLGLVFLVVLVSPHSPIKFVSGATPFDFSFPIGHGDTLPYLGTFKVL